MLLLFALSLESMNLDLNVFPHHTAVGLQHYFLSPFIIFIVSFNHSTEKKKKPDLEPNGHSILFVSLQVQL